MRAADRNVVLKTKQQCVSWIFRGISKIILLIFFSFFFFLFFEYHFLHGIWSGTFLIFFTYLHAPAVWINSSQYDNENNSNGQQFRYLNLKYKVTYIFCYKSWLPVLVCPQAIYSSDIWRNKISMVYY